MPLREDILNPISEALPAGENLRYAPVLDKIKEARRQDDDAPQGEWQRERKVADFPLVIKLASETIATKSKDIQLAAWLTEALLNREGYTGLHEGLNLIRGILENFWEGCWPEVDEDDTEMRAAPIDWVGSYLVIPAKRVPITRGGHDYLKYLEAKQVGTEPVYEDSDARKEAWAEAIADGKMSFDDFQKAINATSKDFYQKSVDAIDACLQVMEDSQPIFEEKFGEYAPSYGRLRDTLEEVRRVVNQWLQKKIEAEAPAEPVEEEPVAEEVTEEAPAEETSWGETPAAPAPRKKVRRAAGGEPTDKEDAALQAGTIAAFWRREDPYSPAPYLMLRGMRWGEIRAASSLDPSLFEAPSTEVRTSLKRLLNEGNYAELIETAETAMAEPCGRAWLDLQRYVVAAVEYQGYSAIAEAIRAEFRALIRDFPDLLHSTLLDDTPTANRDTIAWYEEFRGVGEPAPQAEAPVSSWAAPPPLEEPVETTATAEGEEAPPDSFQLAMDALRSGRTEEAISILSDEIGRQSSGRGRFQRKMQLAQICLSAGQENIAKPLLEELAEAVDKHQLEEWEAPDLVAHALSLLYSCLQQGEADPVQKVKLYSRICRLSPVQALKHASHAFAQGR